LFPDSKTQSFAFSFSTISETEAEANNEKTELVQRQRQASDVEKLSVFQQELDGDDDMNEHDTTVSLHTHNIKFIVILCIFCFLTGELRIGAKGIRKAAGKT